MQFSLRPSRRPVIKMKTTNDKRYTTNTKITKFSLKTKIET